MEKYDELYEILDYLIEKYDIEEDDVAELQTAMDAITGIDEDVVLMAAEDGDDFVDGEDEED